MKRIIAALFSLIFLAIPALAQETKTQLNTDVSTNFPDNTTGAITPAILRTVVNNMIASWQQSPRVNAQTGTTYNMVVGDYGYLVTFSNASPVAVTVPQATGSFVTWNAFVCNKGAGDVTFSGTPSTIGGAATLVLHQNQCQALIADGTNYQIGGSTATIGIAVGSTNVTGGTTSQVLYDNNHVVGELALSGTGSVCMTTNCVMTTPNLGTPSTANLANATGLPITTGVSGLGTTVSTVLGVNIGSAGSIARYVASGTLALSTTPISSAACSSAQTASATGTLTTDKIAVNFNGDPTAVAGYVPLTTGMLTIIVYPTADNVNAKVCNNTAATITPGNVTLNWMVLR